MRCSMLGIKKTWALRVSMLMTCTAFLSFFNGVPDTRARTLALIDLFNVNLFEEQRGTQAIP
jgi:hypothetical protein